MIPTVDAVNVLHSWASRLATYPEGSITPRTILLTLPLSVDSAEEMISSLNFELTKEIYRQATRAAADEAERVSVKRRLGGVMSFKSAAAVKIEQEKMSSNMVEIALRHARRDSNPRPPA